MEDTDSEATIMATTTSKIQQLQKAFAELESHRAITLNMKWKQLEEHFDGLQKSVKRRFMELEDQEKAYNSKITKAQEILEKREAAVAAREQASLQRLQEKRDAAVSSIFIALQSPRKRSYAVHCEEQIESSSVEDGSSGPAAAECNSSDMKKPCQTESFDVKYYPELVKFCQEMDSEGLHKFISDNRKNLAAIREEIPLSLKAATDPASLILDSLKGFYGTDGSSLDWKKDSNLLGLRRTCIMLMECLSILLMNMGRSFSTRIISQKVRQRAKAIAEEWKPKLSELEVDASNGNSLEAHAFLQLVATFGIDSGFDQEMLSKLIPMVSRRRQTADLCRSLGLSEKMPGVINVLVNSGRQIDAVNLAFAFELTKQFSPASLLDSYLTEARKVSSPVRCGNSSPTAQNDASEKELTALKAVIKCIEENKLEEHYPVDPLQKRVIELEKAKAEKKRGTEAAKPQSKRPRANAIGHGHRVSNTVSDKNFYARVSDGYPPYAYDRPTYAYNVPTHVNHIPSVMGPAVYSIAPGHSNFFGNGYQYQPAYLH